MTSPSSDNPSRDHWESVFRTKQPAELSWRQECPARSLALIRELAAKGDAVLDVGAGESALAGLLVREGYVSVAALDISAAAIMRARERAGPLAGAIQWIVGDVLESPALGRVQLWHDRAVFHFLNDAEERARYIDLAAATVEQGGHVVIATFAADGPERCSGLPVRRYDAPALAEEFGERFALARAERDVHTTPWGKEQPFTLAALCRVRA